MYSKAVRFITFILIAFVMLACGLHDGSGKPIFSDDPPPAAENVEAVRPPGVSDEEEQQMHAYLDKLEPLSHACPDALHQLFATTKKIVDDEDTSNDGVWSGDLDTAIAGVNSTCGAFDSVSPVPAKFETAHAYFTAAAQYFRLGTQAIYDGYHKRANLRIASNYIGQASEAWDKALEALPR